ncbi:hypothetical protein TRFO_23272 [Tritrichomonas foetus]|uniref:Maspardin n=1 Tax=Tritrichomonas foetus TaxID=1144522 RepID=A0A1J4KES2_9EUKA|nr:hypothetical protein TRFO_23272 [Tritrichomonas foetus]|eukprot:OHT08260.1 hypothetical protein TRFO_23272 [Tritrichomonas foetus]
MNNVVWYFRQGGRISRDEAIILIPSIAEDTNSMYLVASDLMASNYRVVIVSIPAYENIHEFLNGFDLFTAKLLIGKVHLIGFGFGGFLSLHIASYQQLSAIIKSITLVSSFLSTQVFKKSSGLFSKLTGKAVLVDELCINQVPKNLKESCVFIADLLENIPSQIISARLKMRSNAPSAPIPEMPQNSILIIQSLDWAFKLNDGAVPHRVINTSQKVALLSTGGNHPHLAAPDKLLVFIKHHLEKWITKDEVDDEIDHEEEEEEY